MLQTELVQIGTILKIVCHIIWYGTNDTHGTHSMTVFHNSTEASSWLKCFELVVVTVVVGTIYVVFVVTVVDTVDVTLTKSLGTQLFIARLCDFSDKESRISHVLTNEAQVFSISAQRNF